MNGQVLRLLDANANRAREALRVLEDYARFVRDDRDLSAELKTLRHELTGVVGPVLADAIVHRDTAGDVGTGTKTPSEVQREDLSEVVIAAGKRLGEAVRAIGEYLKIDFPERAGAIEALRYRFYEVEKRIALSVRPSDRFAHVRLCVLITERCCRRPWLEAAELALLGGADALQLREKELEGAELLCRARQLVSLCRKHKAMCIINDRPDVAILSHADGVHVGQDDLPVPEVRKLLGRDKIIGVSTHRIEQARQAVRDGADYIGVGPFFRSETKPRDFLAGPDYARHVAREISVPAVAIAGITAANVDEVLETGMRAVAVTAAVTGSDDPRAAAAALKQKLMVGQKLVGQKLEVGQKLVGQTFLSAGGANIPVCPSPGILEITRRRLPHWHLAGSTYFVTFRVAGGTLSVAERKLVLDHVKTGHGKYYTLFAAVIMPDHVHLMVRPNDGVELPRICKGVKGVSARLVNQHRGTVGHVWQDESWDRIMRNQQELDEKLGYMLENPVKKGLVQDPWEYDGWYFNAEAM